MKMAYIAINPENNHCYGVTSADPEFAEQALKDVKSWKKDGAIIELVPAEFAKARFCEHCEILSNQIKNKKAEQRELFNQRKEPPCNQPSSS